MIKIAEAFIERANSKEHIKIFIEKASLSLKFQSNDEHLTFIISNGSISIDTAQRIENPDVFISGSHESISLILDGKAILRKVEKTGEIKIFATFRNTLFLENLFILAKEHDKNNLVNQKFLNIS